MKVFPGSVSIPWLGSFMNSEEGGQVSNISPTRHEAGTIAVWTNNTVMYTNVSGMSPNQGMVIMIQEWRICTRHLAMDVDMPISADWN